MPYHHLCLRGLGGGWHGRARRREVVLAVDGPAEVKRASRLSTSSSARSDRWGSGGGGGGGGGGGCEAVVVLLVQFIDKVVDVLMQLQVPAVQGVHGQFIDRVLDISVAHREVPTVQTVQKTVLAVDVPVISCDSSQSGEHSCCATDFVGAVLGQGEEMPVYVQRQVPCI